MSMTEQRAYTVEGMSCAHCELSVREEVEELAGVATATADHVTGRLDVQGETLDDDAIRSAVETAGYRVTASVGPGTAR